MAQSPREYELVLLGATGYTGQFAAEWINRHLPSDLKWAIAGRNTKKLQTIIDKLVEANPNRKRPSLETIELEPSKLDALAKRTKLIITTIGPFMFHGEPVLSACASNGTHYLDCTGEIPWYYDMITKYHALAQKTGAIIIPQCGLDSVPADITSYVLARHIRKTLNAATLSVTLTLYAFKTGVSGGTSTTALNLFSHYPLTHLAKSMKPYSISPIGPPSNPSPSPSSPFLYRLLGLKHIPDLGGVQTTGTMASVDTCLVHRSWGLYASSPTTTNNTLSYGPRFRFQEYMRTTSLLFALTWKIGFGLAGFLLAFPPTRWILSPILSKFVIPKAGEGPSRESMKKDFMSYRAVGVADTAKKERVMATLDCAHGAYEITGLTLAAAASVIIRGDLKSTEAGRVGGGVLTPALLGEELVEKLNEFGMKIKVGV